MSRINNINSLIAHSLAQNNNHVSATLGRRSTGWKINREQQQGGGSVAGRIDAGHAGIPTHTDSAGPTPDDSGVAFENISAANSAISDNDFAAETASLTRYQILCQSARAILSHPFTLSGAVRR